VTTKGRFFGRVFSSWLAAGSHNARVFILDAVCLVFAVYLGYALRLTFFITGGFRAQFAIAAAVFTPIVLAVLFIGKIYSISWPQASVEEYARLFRWYIAAVIVFCFVSYFPRRFVVPRSSLAIMVFAALLLLTGMRATWRLLLIYQSGDSARGRRTLIIGTGEPAAQLARSLTRGDSQLRPVGFIDDDPQHKGLIIASLRVLGGKSDIPKVIRDKAIDTVLIALSSPTGPEISSYMDILTPCGVTVRVLPSMADIADGQVSVSRLRSVKLEDLLRREPVHLDDAATETS
jgi:FlaA1/EpsC-like NDP-sugar epimerase